MDAKYHASDPNGAAGRRDPGVVGEHELQSLLEAPLPSNAVVLQTPSRPTQLVFIRAVAQALAIQADLDLDSIDDTTIAVDEACTQLIALSKPDAALSCRFAQIPLGLRISVSTTTDARRRPDTGTFGWHVLDTAVTALAIHTVEATEATESELTIDFLIAPTRRDEQ